MDTNIAILQSFLSDASYLGENLLGIFFVLHRLLPRSCGVKSFGLLIVFLCHLFFLFQDFAQVVPMLQVAADHFGIF